MKPTRPIIFFLLFALVVGMLPANGAGLLSNGTVAESTVRTSACTAQLAVTTSCQQTSSVQAKSAFDDDFDDDDLDFELVAATKSLPVDLRHSAVFPVYSQPCLYSLAYLIQFSKRGPPVPQQ